MDSHYKEVLRSQLKEEIGRIGDHVKAIGAPRRTEERSLIARYGKLLYVSQLLLSTLSKAEPGGDDDPGLRSTKLESSVTSREESRSFSRQLGLN